MAAALGIPAEMRVELDKFQAEHGLILTLNEDSVGDVTVKTATERQECTTTLLYMDGWISCPAARGMADKLGITKSQAGKLLDLLKVKIKDCELGCF